MFYHYTSPEALINILQEDGIHFRFSRFDCLNDMNEGKVAKQIQEEVCLALKKEYPEKVNLLEEIVQIEPDYKEFFVIHEEQTIVPKLSATVAVHNIETIPYVLSFSQNLDSLPMWNYYAKGRKNEGYNIGICLEHAALQIQNSNVSGADKYDVAFNLISIIYDKNEQFNMIKRFIVEMMNNPIGFDKKRYKAQLNVLSISFKESVFKHEEEIRVVCYIPKKSIEEKDIDNIIKFRTANGLIIPYVDVLIQNKKTLKEVTIGPLLECEIAKNSLEIFLKERGYSRIDINVSEVPIRY